VRSVTPLVDGDPHRRSRRCRIGARKVDGLSVRRLRGRGYVLMSAAEHLAGDQTAGLRPL
jgi:hypothetical protein